MNAWEIVGRVAVVVVTMVIGATVTVKLCFVPVTNKRLVWALGIAMIVLLAMVASTGMMLVAIRVLEVTP